MREHRSLRLTGRSRRIDHDRRIVGFGIEAEGFDPGQECLAETSTELEEVRERAVLDADDFFEFGELTSAYLYSFASSSPRLSA